ncbi:SpoIIIAH-like family protein [Paenibacillus sp.]|uniref:SpoIIIAH-like family protein n=1 Tax=Paenibacillus sp. TaxID=58172 RepID=UPI002811C967|nr:SpoIIIAH-like family protein [Paenibacillus sp.]
MNTRRQTVWLVSMLGLMVVLSAYYLFTDEADQIPVPTEQTAQNEIIVEGVGMMDPTSAQPDVTIDDIATLEEDATADGAAEGTAEGAAESATDGVAEGADPATPEDATAEAEETITDEQVLEQVSNRSSADAITAMQIERDSDFSRQIEALTAAMTNEEASEQQITEAINKHSALMDLEAKLIAFEEKLLGDYENVAVMYDDQKQHFTVHVSAAQLEKSEAVSIVTEAMKDLNIAIHQITVKLYN